MQHHYATGEVERSWTEGSWEDI